MQYFFCWNTSLSNERQNEIQNWLNTLTPEQESMLQDLLTDKYNEGQLDAEEAHDLSEE